MRWRPTCLVVMLVWCALLSNCDESRPPIVPIGPCGPFTCEGLNVECGNRGDPCGGTLTCPFTCDPVNEHCENNKCEPGACEPSTCEAEGAECGMIDDGCGEPLTCPECEEDFVCVSNQCVSDSCTPEACESLNLDCGTFWDVCEGEGVECSSSCTESQSCVAGSCATPSGVIINEFVFDHGGAGSFDYVELFGQPNFDLSTGVQQFQLILVDGDSDDEPGQVLRAYFMGSNGTAGQLDANGYWLSPFGSLDVPAGTVTILLVTSFIPIATGIDLDSTDDGVFDNPSLTFNVVSSIAVSDPILNEEMNFIYSGAPVLTPSLGGAGETVQGASRIPNGSGSFVRNDFGGFGLPGFSTPAASGEAINTPNGETTLVSSESGFNVRVP